MRVIITAFATLACLSVSVYGHGRLQVPKTRKHAAAGSDVYENDPVPGSASPSFACRNDPGASVPPENNFQAGGVMNVRWALSALHVGDCALYVSYDYDLRGADRANMKFFKIANWRKCKDLNGQDQTVRLPSWLPAGRAVFRWDWYALHVFPTIEFYAQCADSMIQGSSQSLQPAQVPAYSVVDFLALDGSGGKFRNPWVSPAPTFFTGPPCACRDSQHNGCPLSTVTSSPGYIDVPTLASCDGGSGPIPTSPPAESPVAEPTARETTPSPVVGVSPTPPPSFQSTAPPSATAAPGNCPATCQTCRTYNGSVCSLWCSKWDYCGSTADHKAEGSVDCRVCGNAPPAADPTAAPTNSQPAPTRAPTSVSSGDCVATAVGLPKGKSNKYKKFAGDACACSLQCAADAAKAFGFSAKKKQCLCFTKPKTKKAKNGNVGKLKISEKGDYVYATLTL